jgi:hypothetical protein
MSVMTLLIVLLVIALLGGIVPWAGFRGSPPPTVQPPQPGMLPQPQNPYWNGYAHGYGYGPYVPGGIGLILLIVIILVVVGGI